MKISTSIVRFGQIFLWLYSKLLVRVILKVQINKPNDISKSTNAVFVGNHVSLFDPSILVGSLSWKEFTSVYPIKAMLAKWYYHSPLLPFVYLIGCFPARPLFPFWKNYAGTTAAVKILRAGQSLGLYPEGERIKNKRIPAKYGVVKILQQTTNQTVYLCKVTKQGTRSYTLTVKRLDKVAKYTDPDKIMDEVYKL